MDTALCTLSLVLACQIDDFSIEQFEEVHGRPKETMYQIVAASDRIIF